VAALAKKLPKSHWMLKLRVNWSLSKNIVVPCVSYIMEMSAKDKQEFGEIREYLWGIFPHERRKAVCITELRITYHWLHVKSCEKDCCFIQDWSDIVRFRVFLWSVLLFIREENFWTRSRSCRFLSIANIAMRFDLYWFVGRRMLLAFGLGLT